MSEINTNPDSFNDDEITLKEIILKIKDYFTEVVKHWKIVLLVTFLFLSYLAYKSIKSEYSYKAKLTFMINQTEGSSLSGLGGILGQFGFGEKVNSTRIK